MNSGIISHILAKVLPSDYVIAELSWVATFALLEIFIDTVFDFERVRALWRNGQEV